MKDVQIPVAHCFKCEDRVPVVVRDITPKMLDLDLSANITVIYCPECSEILNGEGDIEVKWYTPEELFRATGWKIND